jgi:hypothetical protein
MPEPTTPDEARDYYAHVRQCTDGLCRTWPHMWAATAEGEQYIAAQQLADQVDRERQAA